MCVSAFISMLLLNILQMFLWRKGLVKMTVLGALARLAVTSRGGPGRWMKWAWYKRIFFLKQVTLVFDLEYRLGDKKCFTFVSVLWEKWQCKNDANCSLALRLRVSEITGEAGKVKGGGGGSGIHPASRRRGRRARPPVLFCLKEVGNLDFHRKYFDFSILETNFKLLTLCQSNRLSSQSSSLRDLSCNIWCLISHSFIPNGPF